MTSYHFMGLKYIVDLLKHFQNIEKWIQHEKIHRSCVAEVPTAPNSREGSQFKKSHQLSMKNDHLKKTKLYGAGDGVHALECPSSRPSRLHSLHTSPAPSGIDTMQAQDCNRL